MHINPPWSVSRGDWVFEGMHVHSFTSDDIFKAILRPHATRLLAEPTDIFNTMASRAAATYGGSSAGNLFEKICLWLRPIVGRAIRPTYLTAGNFSSTNPMMIRANVSLLSYDWKQRTLQANVLYQPRISGNLLESGNAFCLIPSPVAIVDEVPSYSLVIFQITVAESHPIWPARYIGGLHLGEIRHC
jgi:hypothetical protein